ncbi:MAG: hypothetical protein AAB906_00565 [Patescibacteria group bacterium]
MYASTATAMAVENERSINIKKGPFSDLEKLLGLERDDLEYNFDSGREMSIRYILPYGKNIKGNLKTIRIIEVVGYMASKIVSQLGETLYQTHDVSKIRGGYKGMIPDGSVLEISVTLRKSLGKKNGKAPHIFRCKVKKAGNEEVFAAVFQLDCWVNISNKLLKAVNKKIQKHRRSLM